MWNGDPNNEGGWGKYIAVPIAVNYWAIQNRCTHEITDTIASIILYPIILLSAINTSMV